MKKKPDEQALKKEDEKEDGKEAGKKDDEKEPENCDIWDFERSLAKS